MEKLWIKEPRLNVFGKILERSKTVNKEQLEKSVVSDEGVTPLHRVLTPPPSKRSEAR
jgi:hypothetical protein